MLCNLEYHRFFADSVNVNRHSESAKKYISNKVLNKQLLQKYDFKVSYADKIIKTIQQPTEV